MTNRTHPMEWAKKVTCGTGGERITPTEKLVLLLLADYTNAGTGDAWPTVATLAKFSGLCERSVRYALSGLKDKGLLSVRYTKIEDAKNAPNRYRLLITQLTDGAPSPVAVVEEPVSERLSIRNVAAELCAEGGVIDELLAGTDPTSAYLTALGYAGELAAAYPELSKDPAGFLRNAVLSRAAFDTHQIEPRTAARLSREAAVLGQDGHARIIQALTHTASADIKGDATSYVIAAARRLSANALGGAR